MTVKTLFYVQHLKGLGHVFRAQRLVAALVEHGFDVTVAFGGLPVDGIGFGRATVFELPPIGTADGSFSALVDAAGQPLDEAYKAHRRERLLALFDTVDPDLLITEMFPFGRRSLRFELVPLLDHARSSAKVPKIAVSVRDILQTASTPARAEEQVATFEKYYDVALVHGDPALCRIEDSLPQAARVSDRICYTGLVAPVVACDETLAAEDVADVVVSVGGGAVGAEILRLAIAAKPLTSARSLRWLLLAGPNMPAELQTSLAEAAGRNVIQFEAFRVDLPRTLRAARLSVQMAGYNTVADMLAAGCRAVVVPFVAGGETEQRERAMRLSAMGRVIMVEPDGLDVLRLASAIDAALEGPQPVSTFNLAGADGSVTCLKALMRGEV